MDIALGIWSAGLFFLAGLMIGKIKWGHSEVWETSGAESGQMGMETPQTSGEGRRSEGDMGRSERGLSRAERSLGTAGKKDIPGEKKIPLGFSVGSPVAGTVNYFDEGTKRGVLIVPEQEVVYAPAAGKIIHLYPTGNAMRLRTDYGLELLIQAGLDTGELEGRYYRAKVLKNEVVNKGKPLLEFDVEGIRSEGFDPSVRMSVEDAQNYQDITLCGAPRVKAGEDLMWVHR